MFRAPRSAAFHSFLVATLAASFATSTALGQSAGRPPQGGSAAHVVNRPILDGADLPIGGPVAHRNPRVVFITTKECPRCDQELERLRRPGGDFEKMQARGWKIGTGAESHLQIVDRDEISELVEKLDVLEYPTVACIDDGEILRSFKSGCTTPLDMWTFGFLAKGIDERPPGFVPEKARVETTGHYPLRGNHWSVEDDWNPMREKTVAHLRGPNHGHQIRTAWAIETWSHEELRSLHDDLHEREMGGVTAGSYRTQQVNQFGATRKAGGF